MLALPAGAFGQTEAPPAQPPAQTQIPAPGQAPSPTRRRPKPSRPRRLRSSRRRCRPRHDRVAYRRLPRTAATRFA